jgi:hypothetical protein
MFAGVRKRSLTRGFVALPDDSERLRTKIDLGQLQPPTARRCAPLRSGATLREAMLRAVPMKERQLNAARVLGRDYWLYVVFDCAGPEPYLVVVQDPARLAWPLISDQPAVPWAKKGSIGAEMTFFIGAIEALTASKRV